MFAVWMQYPCAVPNLYSCTWQTWNATAGRLRETVVGPSKAYFHESTSFGGCVGRSGGWGWGWEEVAERGRRWSWKERWGLMILHFVVLLSFKVEAPPDSEGLALWGMQAPSPSHPCSLRLHPLIRPVFCIRRQVLLSWTRRWDPQAGICRCWGLPCLTVRSCKVLGKWLLFPGTCSSSLYTGSSNVHPAPSFCPTFGFHGSQLPWCSKILQFISKLPWFSDFQVKLHRSPVSIPKVRGCSFKIWLWWSEAFQSHGPHETNSTASQTTRHTIWWERERERKTVSMQI